MIQANCRARFTAADFDFVVRTLARSQSESVSLVDLLAGPQAEADESPRQYLSDMLIALSRATQDEAFLLRAHVGNYSLFISGIFHENTQRRSLRGAPDIGFYENIGRRNYHLVASHE